MSYELRFSETAVAGVDFPDAGRTSMTLPPFWEGKKPSTSLPRRLGLLHLLDVSANLFVLAHAIEPCLGDDGPSCAAAGVVAVHEGMHRHLAPEVGSNPTVHRGQG